MQELDNLSAAAVEDLQRLLVRRSLHVPEQRQRLQAKSAMAITIAGGLRHGFIFHESRGGHRLASDTG